MRIRSPIVTALASCVALAAVATVLFATTPGQATPTLKGLLWVAIFLSLWGLCATLLLLVRQSMAQAMWVGVLPACGAIVLLASRQRGMYSQRLLAVTILATLFLSIGIWWRLRHYSTHD